MKFVASGSLLALALSASVAFAQSPSPAPTFSADRIKADVTFLADDLLEGRDAGTRGYDLAAHYVATRFAALGLQPAVNGSWYQQVPFQQARLGKAGSRLIINGKSFANGKDIIMGPSQFELTQAVSAPVVFVGYGLHAPSRGIDDYAGLDVRGKVVAILSGFPKGMASDIGAHLASEKAKAAQAHGAVATVNIMTPTALRVFPWARRAEYATKPSLTWVGEDGRPYSPAPDIRAAASLDATAARALFAGAPRSLDSIFAESEKEGGNPKGFALPAKVRFERGSVSRRLTSPNVLAVLPGSDPQLRNEYVVVMGHLDHDGIDPTLTGDKIYNGALDNAAGIATMLETARAMVTAPTRPKRSIMFAAVTAEEDGLLGSQYLAKHPVVGSGKVVGVVNLDMPILLYDFTDMIAFGAEHSTLGPIVARATGRDGVTLSPDPAPEQSSFTRSDHYMFVKEGVPSVSLSTGEANGGKAAIEHFEATNYHRVSDDLTQPINWQAGAKFARINYLIAREIADASESPRWYQGSFFGDVFAPNASKAPKP